MPPTPKNESRYTNAPSTRISLPVVVEIVRKSPDGRVREADLIALRKILLAIEAPYDLPTCGLASKLGRRDTANEV